MALAQVGDQFGDPPNSPYGAEPGEAQLGYTDSLFVMRDNNPMTPHLAESWEMASDGTRVTLKIRQGIPFNSPEIFAGEDFGNITAADVAWNLNRQNAGVNLDIRSGLGAQFAATFQEAVAIDESTVEAPMVTPTFWGLPLSEFVIQDADLSIMSKQAYERMGAEAVKLVPVGTGPFTIGDWIPNDRGTVHAVESHWDKTPEIATFTVIQVPEITTRIAMMEGSTIQLASVDFARLQELRDKGLDFLGTMTEADTVTVSVIWPGNLWLDTNNRTGEATNPWESSVYEVDHPWIGCPWGDRCPYTDSDNPAGVSDMEQARLVRWALSMAIERDGVVEVLQGGLGAPLYSEYMGPLYPGWDPNRTVTKAEVDAALAKHDGTDFNEYGIDSPIPNEEWPWLIPTDTARAEELLDLAGYPRGSDGTRFTIRFNKYRCESGDVCLEQADAIATAWESIGVKTDLLSEEYGAVVVPRMADRQQAWPVLKNCSVETAVWPLDWPPPPADTTYSRPSWGCSFETEFLDRMYEKINGSPNKAEREEWHLEMVDYMYYWQLYNGLSQVPRGVAYDPDAIESWNSRSTGSGFWHRPEFIVPK
jgi:ABC-type transport system substrate-binding protein